MTLVGIDIGVGFTVLAENRVALAANVPNRFPSERIKVVLVLKLAGTGTHLSQGVFCLPRLTPVLVCILISGSARLRNASRPLFTIRRAVNGLVLRVGICTNDAYLGECSIGTDGAFSINCYPSLNLNPTSTTIQYSTA